MTLAAVAPALMFTNGWLGSDAGAGTASLRVATQQALASPLAIYEQLKAPSPPTRLPGQALQELTFGAFTAISADGGTAVVGTFGDGAWVYARSPGGWALVTQLTSVGGTVALSADGNTALVGAACEQESDSVLVFTRAGGTWAQQGRPLTPRDGRPAKGCSGFGGALALSFDGNTALVGNESDSGSVGAAWVFTRSGGAWTQQGGALRPTDETGPGSFGSSLALSGDGGIALIGAPADGAQRPGREGFAEEVGPGKAWLFIRSGTTWTQHQTLKPSDEVLSVRGRGQFGSATALSRDGATALVGAEGDNEQGAAWAFTRSGDEWRQQGPKLIGVHEGPGFGGGVALSGDGNSALVSAVGLVGTYSGGTRRGGPGTVWPFTRVGSTWIREPPASGPGSGEFAFGIALSAAGDSAMIGAPDSFEGPGSAWAATLAPMPANSFSEGAITIRSSATLEQQLASSAGGFFSAVATVSSHTPGLVSAREQRGGRCHAKRGRRRAACPRASTVTYGRGSVQVAGAGTTTVVLRPARAVRRALARYQEVAVTLTISFRPNAGPAPAPQSRTIVLELGRRESY